MIYRVSTITIFENIRQLKILGSCTVTVIYRVTTIIILNIQVNFAENIRQLKILRSCLVTIIYRVTTIIILYTGQLCRKYKATENFWKLYGDRNIQGDHYNYT